MARQSACDASKMEDSRRALAFLLCPLATGRVPSWSTTRSLYSKSTACSSTSAASVWLECRLLYMCAANAHVCTVCLRARVCVHVPLFVPFMANLHVETGSFRTCGYLSVV